MRNRLRSENCRDREEVGEQVEGSRSLCRDSERDSGSCDSLSCWKLSLEDKDVSDRVVIGGGGLGLQTVENGVSCAWTVLLLLGPGSSSLTELSEK